MDWLYQRYWLAQMHSTLTESAANGTEEISEAQKAEIARLFTLYKKLQKEVLRDASVSKDKELGRVIQAIERWTIDVGTSAASLGNSAAYKASNATDASTAGCQALAQVMIEAGFLVPTSKKLVHRLIGVLFRHVTDSVLYRKRPSSRDTELPREVHSIWAPLLEHLDDTFEDFTSALIWQCLELLDDEKGELAFSPYYLLLLSIRTSYTCLFQRLFSRASQLAEKEATSIRSSYGPSLCSPTKTMICKKRFSDSV